MSTRRSNYIALFTAAVFLVTGLVAAQSQEADLAAPRMSTDNSIRFAGFMAFSERTMAYRADRLITLEDFNELAEDRNTIILDSRSAAAFDAGHIEGAINLNFADFTEDKLADVIPDRTTRILIYCNNNFIDDVEPVPAKSAQLALNIPTFVNLFGYGYMNVYELGEMVSLNDPAISWVSTPQPTGPDV